MNRKLAREFCMKMLFQMSIHNQYDYQILLDNLEEEATERQQEHYINQLVQQIISNRAEIDETIMAFSKGWKLDRIAKVDLAILRIAFGEILYMEEIPPAVSINEAIELAKRYSTHESASFINGILGKYVEEKGLKKHEQ
ncbi:transcription antitermination factor NusB [Alkaliphilus crotonatoxidans]